MHALKVEHIGPGAVESGRLVHAVEVEDEMVLGAHGGRTVYKLGHRLVVAVHEIDFESFDAHGGIVAAHLLHVAVEGPIPGPKHDAYPLCLGVRDQFGQVNLGHDLHQVGLEVDRPTLIEQHIGHTAAGRKVDVLLVGCIVDARLEGDTVEVPVVPPLPGRLARLNPGGILQS